jgi:tRNA threonylcarbamoyladenosine biosynthesis protein TsaB
MSSFSCILVIDTAMNGCGVAVRKSGKTVSEVRPMMRGQSEHLMPLVLEIMQKAGAAYKDLEAVITTRGPGAFTGLRIGMATAKATALARGIPIFGITTLRALALQYAQEKKPAENFAVVIETKREDFYFQVFDKDAKPVSEEKTGNAQGIAQDLKSGVLIGDGVERLESEKTLKSDFVFNRDYILPDPAVIAWAAENLSSEIFISDPSPLYLRAPDVTMPKSNQYSAF